MAQLTDVVERHGGRVFADEIHGPLVYPGMRHIPYASTSEAAASHTLTATSASKAWNLPGLKCAQVILTNEPDRQRWEDMGFFASHGASNPGVVANIAAYRHGEAWLDEVLGYLDDSRRLLAGLLSRHLPQVRYRPPDGTYLAWLDCTAMDLPDSPGALVTDRARITVVDGPAFGMGGAGAFRFNFATPQPILDRDGRAHRRCAEPRVRPARQPPYRHRRRPCRVQRSELPRGQHLGDLYGRARRILGVVQQLSPGPPVVPAKAATRVGPRRAMDALGEHRRPGYEHVQCCRVGRLHGCMDALRVQLRRKPVEMVRARMVAGAVLHLPCLASVGTLSVVAVPSCQAGARQIRPLGP